MSPVERWTVWISAVATGLTGLGFMWAKYLVAPTEAWAVINHPLEPWFLKLHILIAPVFVFAVGLIVTRHIVPQIRNKKVDRGRRSGLVMVWMLAPMVGSGYLLQVVTLPIIVTALVVLHIGTGALFLVGLVGHGAVLVGRALDSDAPRHSPPAGLPRPIAEPSSSLRRGAMRSESGDPS